jgi:pimeloyl-ACP methyl ester carboxylesterase
MLSSTKRFSLLFSFVTLLVSLFCGSARAQTISTSTGTFADGATWLIQVPSNWNGALMLYSHGYVEPGSANPATNVGDPVTGAALLSQGVALAGSSYATTGWAVQQALPDQIATLDEFISLYGQPKVTVAWGHSLGGLITAGLIQNYPLRFNAAMPMCGVLAGGVGNWNEALDSEVAFQTLIDPSVQVVNIAPNPTANLESAEEYLAAAQATPQGQARIALVSALGDVPGWFAPGSPQPAATDYATQELNQYQWLSQTDFPFIFDLRAELEARAGGNVSFNTGIDYAKQLAKSPDQAEVVALYEAAGLSLSADLAALNATTRISSLLSAQRYLERNVIFDGLIFVPVLTLHGTADGLGGPENEQAYQQIVDTFGTGKFLRQVYVNRAGHCSFTPAETLTLVSALFTRIESGQWPSLAPTTLNTEAEAQGPTTNIFPIDDVITLTAPAFISYNPAVFPRPFNILTAACDLAPNPNQCRDILFPNNH